MTSPTPNRTRFTQRVHSRVAYDPGSDPATTGDRPVILLLHDLLADRSAWYPLREALSPRFRVVMPDARGHGASPSLSNQWYTVAELAADALAVLDAEGLSQVHLVGHGLGGATALELAIHSPGRVQTLMLIEPSLQTLADGSQDAIARDEFHQLRSDDRAAADAAYKQLFDRALDTYLVPRHGSSWRQSLSKPQLGAIRRHAPALAALLPALDAYKVDAAAISDLTLPALIVVPDTASRLDKAAYTRLTELLPQATLTSRAERGRFPRTDEATANDLYQLIQGFITENSD